jgi:hypothetical protein
LGFTLSKNWKNNVNVLSILHHIQETVCGKLSYIGLAEIRYACNRWPDKILLMESQENENAFHKKLPVRGKQAK